jgi:hypothetical protein
MPLLVNIQTMKNVIINKTTYRKPYWQNNLRVLCTITCSLVSIEDCESVKRHETDPLTVNETEPVISVSRVVLIK